MVVGYREAMKHYGSVYRVNRAIKSKQLFKIGRGMYSYQEETSELEVVSARYPQAVFTMDSAFYFHGLTDVIPERLHLATCRNMLRIKNPRIRQYFEQKNYFGIGKMVLSFNGVEVSVYDQERMLLELVRRKKEVPFDYYKEIVRSYRKQVERLDIMKLESYIEHMNSRTDYFAILQREVF